MQEARLVAIKDGWAALGDGWAVFGASRNEALDRYQAAEEKHAELRARPVYSALPAQIGRGTTQRRSHVRTGSED